MNDDPIERALREAGTRWRDAQPAPPEPELPDVLANGSPGRHRRGVLTAAGATLTAAVVVVGLHLPGGGTTPINSMIAPLVTPGPDVVRVGDTVEGFGFVIAAPGQPPRLCADMLKEPGKPSCLGVSAELVDVDLSTLPGRQVTGGVVSSSQARVEGSYLGGARIEVHSVGRGRTNGVGGQPLRPPPCDPPPGGWTDQPFATADATAERFVQTHPDTYSGVWWSLVTPSSDQPGDTTHRITVTVVGTTGDVAEARRQFARFYPFNLCVERVRYSKSELDDALRAVRGRAPGVNAMLDSQADQVRVEAVAYEPAVRDAVTVAGPDEVTVTTLVTRTG